jgi:translation elongation factor EF-Tu-like GTPase
MNMLYLGLLFAVAVIAILLFRLRPDAARSQQPGLQPRPVPPGGRFRLEVEDVFNISGRGTVVTGKVQSGAIKLGDSVVLRRAGGDTQTYTVTGIEMFRKVRDQAQSGDNVGLLLRKLQIDAVAKGDVLEQG